MATDFGPGIVIDEQGNKLVVKAGAALDVESGGALKLAGTAVDATAAELNRVADVSGRIVNLTAATLAVAAATHEGRIVTVNKADGTTITLPAATGSGAKYTFIVGTTITSNNVVISPTGDDTMFGTIYGDDGDGEPANAWSAASGNNTITLGGTSNATGGVKGDRIELIDFAADCWNVVGWITQGGTEATPFSTV